MLPARPSGHPRGLRPCRSSHGSLPDRPDATSSTFAPQPAQGAGQLRSRPAAQGFHRTSPRPERAGQAGRCETETRRAQAGAPVWRQRLAGQGARTMRNIFPTRAARRRARLPGRFGRPPAGNVSRSLHGAGRPRTGRPQTLSRRRSADSLMVGVVGRRAVLSAVVAVVVVVVEPVLDHHPVKRDARDAEFGGGLVDPVIVA